MAVPELLNVEEACEFLKISKPTLYKYINDGDVPALKMGNLWKFDKETLGQWITDKIKKDTKTRFKKKIHTAKNGK